MPTYLQKFFLVIIFVKKGGPYHLISFGRKNHGLINRGILYRRSKKVEPKKHWSETRLGEISTNWSELCESPKDVLYNSSIENLLDKKASLIDSEKTRVYCCNLDTQEEVGNENYPFIKTIVLNHDSLRIEAIHRKTVCNYPHTDINCYLTTSDGIHNDSIVNALDWENQPLNTKPFRGLRGNYKTHLIYHFSDCLDYD